MYSTQYGNNPSVFGHADYVEALKIGTPSQIVSYLDERQGLMWERNRKGQGGLYDEILAEAKRRNVGKINALGGYSPYRFGGVDYREAKAYGYTDRQIKDYLDRNPDRLYSGNKPGVQGGLYENIVASIKNDPNDIQNMLDSLKIDFEDQKKTIQDLTDANITNQTNFNTALTNMRTQYDTDRQTYLKQEADRKAAAEMRQRVSMANQARGGQQTDYRLGGAAGAIRGGTAGFRRRPRKTMPEISATGFTSPGSSASTSAKTLNV